MKKSTYGTLAKIFAPVSLVVLQACSTTTNLTHGQTQESRDKVERDTALQIARDQLSTGNPLLQANAVSIQRKVNKTVDEATEWTSGMIQRREAECVVTQVERPAEAGKNARWVAKCTPQQEQKPALSP